MFVKNPDLIDHYLHLFICVFFVCVWTSVSILSSIILWSYLTVGYVNYYGDLFTIIDFLELVLVSLIWWLSILLLVSYVCDLDCAYCSFMES